MWISRVRVTGGFLDGVDLQLDPGLNVVIGPRGAGKTTLLEILRHVLLLPGSENSKPRASLLKHALGSGEVIVDLKDDDRAVRLVVDANGGGLQAEMTDGTALMLGQNELEEIADDPAKRLALIDARAGITALQRKEMHDEVAMLTVQAARARSRAKQQEDHINQLGSLESDRLRLKSQESEFLARSGHEVAEQRISLAKLEAKLIEAQDSVRLLLAARSLTGDLSRKLSDASLAIDFVQARDIPTSVSTEIASLLEKLRKAHAADQPIVEEMTSTFDVELTRLQVEELSLRSEAEPLRSALDKAEKGLGAVTAELRDIDAQISRIEAVKKEADLSAKAEADFKQTRDRLQGELEVAGEELFAARSLAAQRISETLDHNVLISVTHFEDVSRFREILSQLLQGSGLKYNSLSDILATSLLPQTMLRYVESEDIDGLAVSAGIPTERASRVIQALGEEQALELLSAVMLEDAVEFHLQDGAVLKSSGMLSTGQKCAVTLPVVMTDPERIVILDQPEDHLDNHYLVNNILKSLVARTDGGAQTIVATHNPNIPVLGSAGLVAHFRSDGSRSEIDVLGSYDSPKVVATITNLMEGGADAFDRRAAFYAAHEAQL